MGQSTIPDIAQTKTPEHRAGAFASLTRNIGWPSTLPRALQLCILLTVEPEVRRFTGKIECELILIC